MVDLIALRRELHQIPEVGLDLPQTQQRVLQALEGLPLEITLGKSLSSVVGVLRGGRPTEGKRPVVLLRADMDALPVTENTGLDFASTNGAMHACGHDLHMSMLVGAAHELCAQQDQIAGDVVFMFQPGEESVDGCRYMLEEGLLDIAGSRPDFTYAFHVWSSLDKAGVFTTKPGTIMASTDEIRVKVTGRGTHGSSPHLGIDPVPPLAEMALATHQMVTRRHSIFDPIVVTVGQIHAGSAANVIPDSGSFAATLRAFSPESREQALAELPRMFQGIADAHGVELEYTLIEQYPATINDDAQAQLVEQKVTELFGADRFTLQENPKAAAEDFSRLLQAAPGCFIGLGATMPDLDPATAPFNHSAEAQFDDSVLADGVHLFVELVRHHLGQ